MTAEKAETKEIQMTFTIDTENNISAFATQEEAAASTTNPFEFFTSQKELTQLASTWPAERLVAIWNSLPGVEPVKGFKTAKAGASKIWESIQGVGKVAEPAAEPAKPKADKKARGGAKAAKGAPTKGKATKKATPPKIAPKAKKAAKKEEGSGPREGSKTAQVVALLQRKNATLDNIRGAEYSMGRRGNTCYNNP